MLNVEKIWEGGKDPHGGTFELAKSEMKYIERWFAPSSGQRAFHHAKLDTHANEGQYQAQ